MSKTHGTELERDADKERRAELQDARRERDERLTEITKRYEGQIVELRTKAHEERGKVWDEWRERRSEA